MTNEVCIAIQVEDDRPAASIRVPGCCAYAAGQTPRWVIDVSS